MTIAGNAELGQARRQGDLPKLTFIGAQLLSGTNESFDPLLGATLLAEAAEKGGAEAASLMAVLAGAGVCRPQNWEQSLDYLQLAAERGWPSARAQLALLTCDRELASRATAAGVSDQRIWSRLRRAVDLAAWITPPARIVVCESPRIRRMDEFLPRRMCLWIIERARDRVKRARIYDSADGGATVSGSRTNSETDFNIVQSDVALLLVRARIAEATGLPMSVMELTKVLHYSPGERFDLHHDYIDPAEPGLAEEMAARGQRLVTFLVYLNDDFEGGETDFPKIGFRHRGSTGSALYFANVDPGGRPDPMTLHAGLAPVRGEKWLLSQWIRDRNPPDR